MTGARSRYGLAVSALGAVLLAISVFLPWYGVSFTTAGIATAEQTVGELAQQYGNSALQAQVAGAESGAASYAGREFGSLSAHQVLHDLNVVLLVLAGLALLDALVPLARTASPLPDGAGRAVVLLGAIAAVCVIYRMVDPPPTEGLLALKLRGGVWLALFGSLMIALGGIWPRSSILSEGFEDELPGPAGAGSAGGAFAALSGWTPGS